MTDLRQPQAPETQAPSLPSVARESHTDGSTVPVEMQTTVRVRKDLRDKLKKIAVVTDVTIFDLVNELISDHIQRFESALGESVDEMGRKSRRS